MIPRWLTHWWRPKVDLSPEHEARLRELFQRSGQWQQQLDLAAGRMVVVDVESSGLNLARDHLIAIGAVAIQDGRIALHDSFEVVLRQESVSDKGNILVHGIGGSAQRAGEPPQQALLDFLGYLDGAPLLAYHVSFDETMLRKAFRQFFGQDFRHGWADLAYVLPALLPEKGAGCHALDDWLRRFQINNAERHNALADALATAQLGLIALRAARAQKLDRFGDLQSSEKAQRWLAGGR